MAWLNKVASSWTSRIRIGELDEALAVDGIRKMYAMLSLDRPQVLVAESPRDAQVKIDGLRASVVRQNRNVLNPILSRLQSNWAKGYNLGMSRDLIIRFEQVASLLIAAAGPHYRDELGRTTERTTRQGTTWGNGERWRTFPLWPITMIDFPPHDHALARTSGLFHFIVSYGNGKSGTSADDFNMAEAMLAIHSAGPWACWFYDRTSVISHPPSMHFDQGDPTRGEPLRLHNEGGPAIRFPDRQQAFFWRGVQVPEELIMMPGSIPMKMVLAEENLELRRAMMERIGYAKVLDVVGAKVVHTDECGDLLVAKLDDDQGQMAKFVRVRDASTNRVYVIRVDPTSKSCREALARSALQVSRSG